jgi:hypothetical protein
MATIIRPTIYWSRYEPENVYHYWAYTDPTTLVTEIRKYDNGWTKVAELYLYTEAPTEPTDPDPEPDPDPNPEP